MSPDERAFVLVVERALRRARLIAVAEAGVWGFAAATISMTAAVAVGVAVAASRLIAVSRSGIVRALERALPDARNLFVTADEISRRQLSAGGVAADRVFAGASSRAQLVNLRRACPLLPFWYAAIFAGLAWTIALIVRGPHGPAQMLFPSRPAPAVAASDRRMTIAVIIRPPAYTGLPEARSTDPAELRAVEGSVAILSIDTAADRMTVDHDGDARTLARSADGRFSDRMRLTKTGFVVVASDAGDRRSLPIVVTPDALPSVRVTSPARDLVYAGGSASIAFAAHATDDFGLRSLSLRYTKVSGSGEEYAFTEGEIPLGIARTNARDWSGTATRTLADLGLHDGDMLVYRAVAADARPGDGSAESDAFFIELSRLGIAAGDAFSLPEQETRYALSQQMLILKTDRLARQHGTLTADRFSDASLNLAVEQRMIRAEFVFMLGGEIADEEVEAERSVELQAGRLANRGQGDLRAATIAMSQAEKLLTAANPSEALAAERDAVAALQRAFARDRYILRASPTRVDIDPKRRLTGDLAGAAGWLRPIPDAPPNRKAAQLLNLLHGIGELRAPNRSRALVLAEQALRIDAGSRRLREAAAALQLFDIDKAFSAVSVEAKGELSIAPVEQELVAPGLRRALAERER